ncbi:hypothetical protein [Elizabethkingia meningoseptica]|uniref:hypothetical protein n=1 Tax=Elizabethkingia meningoseptica TaxID=238 RepID=UPI0008419C15|nr:hypothetical protein [Elizabethkingia meningoseptica]ODM52390.1 hypothetical protein BES09_12120 [Elizabethkingia meningoseptica]OHT27303.1 hypothetical protein BFF93_12130 [Elizabethkingia meningoseptica]OPC12928.1 hypothetical protein BAX93_04205 [Elizabethkingia meningoseptica]
MKKSYFYLLCTLGCSLLFNSCDRNNDNPSQLNENASIGNPEARISFTSTQLLIESRKVDMLTVDQTLNLEWDGLNIYAILQADANLVLYARNTRITNSPRYTLWATNKYLPYPIQTARLVAQLDGNLVVYRDAPNIPSNMIWASYTDTKPDVTNPSIKLQVVKKTNALNSGSPKYYVKFILEGNNSDRKVIAEVDITSMR